MNLLIDRPPQTVMIGDTEYEINSDFRVSILFELLMQDETIPDHAKLTQAAELYFPRPIMESAQDAFRAIAWFYGCGRSDKARRHAGASDDGKRNTAYSFDYDDEYIYAAFRQQYGVNLATVKYLHWWEFRAMFKALDEKCEIVKIMGYRMAKITKDMSKTEKQFLRKMKRIHALPVSLAEQQETETLVDALMNGGDLTGLL